ncbi:MAG: putative toxin-antitoxin system toxin component, PIN family [Salegentibacter sp.]
MKNKKIILDTNLWSSFLISNDFVEIDKLVQEKEVTFLFSEESLKEFIEVVERPKFKKFFSRKDVEKLLGIFDQYAVLIKII